MTLPTLSTCHREDARKILGHCAFRSAPHSSYRPHGYRWSNGWGSTGFIWQAATWQGFQSHLAIWRKRDTLAKVVRQSRLSRRDLMGFGSWWETSQPVCRSTAISLDLLLSCRDQHVVKLIHSLICCCFLFLLPFIFLGHWNGDGQVELDLYHDCWAWMGYGDLNVCFFLYCFTRWNTDLSVYSDCSCNIAAHIPNPYLHSVLLCSYIPCCSAILSDVCSLAIR